MEISSVWIVDSRPLLRSGLRMQLEGRGFEVASEAGSIDEILKAPAKASPPQILVMDAGLGSAGVAKLKSAWTAARVVVLADSAELALLSEMFAAGVDGYMLKSISPDALIESLRLVMTGEKVFPSTLTNFLGAMRDHQAVATGDRVRVGSIVLSQRELEIIRNLAEGHTNKSIAKTLDITEATVKVHIKGVLRKLGADNRTQIAIWAVQHGLTNAHRFG